MAEHLMLNRDTNIEITPSRLVVEGKAYAIRNITTVAHEALEPEHSRKAYAMAGLMLFLMAAISYNLWSFTCITYVLGGLACVLLVVMLLPLDVYRAYFRITLRTSSGEELVIQSQDAKRIADIASRLNQAMEAMPRAMMPESSTS